MLCCAGSALRCAATAGAPMAAVGADVRYLRIHGALHSTFKFTSTKSTKQTTLGSAHETNMFRENQIDIHNLGRGIGPVSERNANIKYFHETALFRGILSGRSSHLPHNPRGFFRTKHYYYLSIWDHDLV